MASGEICMIMQKTPSGSLPQPTVQELTVATVGETGAETEG